MLRRFKKYLEKKSLILSSEKTKVMVFEKRKGRTKKRRWKWGEEELEEVKEFSYLGYIMQKNGGAEKHILERRKKAMITMKKTWSIGERLFREGYIRRMKMFEALVESVSFFGAEIWGWRKQERLDGIQRKYVKWILGLERTTPKYIVVEEGKLVKIKEKALKRALKYEEKIRTTGKKLVEECWKERKKEWGAGREGKWARIRRKILEEEGDGNEIREESREEEENIVQRIIGKIREKEKAERK